MTTQYRGEIKQSKRIGASAAAALVKRSWRRNRGVKRQAAGWRNVVAARGVKAVAALSLMWLFVHLNVNEENSKMLMKNDVNQLVMACLRSGWHRNRNAAA